MNINGDLTIDGCTIDSIGLQYSFREVIINNNDMSDGVYESKCIITNSTISLRDYGVNSNWMYHTVVMQPASELIIGKGAEITIDHTYHDERLAALVINDDWAGCGSGGSLRIEGGRLTIRSA